MHRLCLRPRKYSWYSFPLEASQSQGHSVDYMNETFQWYLRESNPWPSSLYAVPQPTVPLHTPVFRWTIALRALARIKTICFFALLQRLCCKIFRRTELNIAYWATNTLFNKGKVIPLQAQRVGTGIALLFHDRRTERGWMVNSTPPSTLYPWQRPGTHCTGG